MWAPRPEETLKAGVLSYSIPQPGVPEPFPATGAPTTSPGQSHAPVACFAPNLLSHSPSMSPRNWVKSMCFPQETQRFREHSLCVKPAWYPVPASLPCTIRLPSITLGLLPPSGRRDKPGHLGWHSCDAHPPCPAKYTSRRNLRRSYHRQD